ncbi:MAG: hypothetical protein WC657_09085 [Candidatus Paceibacterota bacterium]|jgi:hypothetical protein
MSRLSEEKGIVYVLKPADYAGGGTGESINTEGFTLITYLLQCATFTDNGGAGADLTIKSGSADATQTTAETFYYRLGGAAQGSASADVFAAATSAATLELIAATYTNKLLILEVPIREITSGQPWLTLALNTHGTAANCSCVAILSGLRYAQNQPPTALA